MPKIRRKTKSTVLPSRNQKEKVFNRNETIIKYNINVNNSAELFKKKEFFPQELQSYIELLNKLFKRQNEIMAKKTVSGKAEKEYIELPKESQYLDLPMPTLTTQDEIKKYETDIVKYLTQGRRNKTAPAGAEKHYLVAMASAKKKKGGTKKGKRKSNAKPDDDDNNQSKRGKKKKGSRSKLDVITDSKKNLKPIMTYELSDLANLKNGISAVPAETCVKKMICFRAEPAKPEISCFRSRLADEVYYYKPSLTAGLISTEGTGYILYPNRDIAIEITKGRIGKKLVVYTESKRDKLGNYFESVPVAIFDDFGNGAVYDTHGNIRLNYDQGEGALYDTPSRMPLFWKWNKSQFLIQRRQDLRYVDEDEPDNFEEVEEEDESEEKTADEDKDQKKKKIKGTAKKKTKKDRGKRKVSKSDGDDDDDDDDDDDEKAGKKTGTRKNKGKSVKGSRKEKRRKSGRKSQREANSTKQGGRGKKTGERFSTKDIMTIVSAKKRLGKLKGFLDLGKDQKKRILPPISKPPKILIPITEIKPIAVKVTEHVSLRIMNQEHIHIEFTYFPFHITLHLGMRIYPEILERIDKIAVDANDNRRVPCYFEFLHKRTFSLIELNSKRKKMLEKGRKEKLKKRINQAFTMGTYIYLRRKKITTKERIDTLAHKNVIKMD